MYYIWKLFDVLYNIFFTESEYVLLPKYEGLHKTVDKSFLM